MIFDKPSDVEDLLNQQVMSQMFNFGKFVLCDISSSEDGLWTEIDGGKVWTLAIEASDAKGISLYYDDFGYHHLESYTFTTLLRHKKNWTFYFQT